MRTGFIDCAFRACGGATVLAVDDRDPLQQGLKLLVIGFLVGDATVSTTVIHYNKD